MIVNVLLRCQLSKGGVLDVEESHVLDAPSREEAVAVERAVAALLGRRTTSS